MFSALPAYAELHCLSNFSFLRGASHPEELVERARALGYSALAITDECSLAGVVRAHVAAKEVGLPLIIGSEIRLDDGPRLVLLAADREGYGNLSELITAGRRRAKKGSYSLSCADLDQGLPGCLALLLPPHPGPLPRGGEGKDLLAHARWLAERFPGNAWIAAELLCGPDDRARLTALRELGNTSGLPLVAAGDVHMHVRSRRRLQDTLSAVRLGKPVRECGHALYPNGERHLRLRLRLANIYPPELLAETLAVAARCDFSLDSLRYEYPEELVPPCESPASWLYTLTEAGLAWRFPGGVPPQARSLVEHELALIAELGYEPYFLTVHDVVKFARERGILCQGRGSAANSAVCYALGITEVDPARMNMLFERFISRERNEPPDIDVDFEHQRREEVIQYIYGKYGRERTALAATVITYRPKSALRDVGKALGFDLQQVDRLSKNLAWWDDRHHLPERLREAGFDPEAPPVRQLLDLAATVIGFPRHLSQHVGGFVIAKDLLLRLVPIENAAMPERSVIQWDKDDLDALGLLKIDVLALGMLSAIRRALDLVGRQRGAPLGMGDVPPEDPAVYEMIQHADTMGVFQIESRAQMSMLPRQKPSEFYERVNEVAIVRPGPIQGGMVHPYLRRRQGLEPVVYPSEAVKGVLGRTLGVPIFQEQVMQLAVVAAGFTPGEADRLRRSMAAWKRKGGLEHFQERLIRGMRSRGYAQEFAERIYQQILGFGEYGFPESHSASFALLVYVSAWLKRHEPAAFLAALLNSQPMGFYAPSQLVQDARRHGVQVRPVDVCASEWECSLEKREEEAQPAVRLGFLMVQGLSQAGAERIVTARKQQPFESAEDLAHRAALNRHDLKCLAAAGTLESLSGHRHQAFWDVAGIEMGTHMLRDAPMAETQPALPSPTEGENLVADYASLGLSLGRHPLALLRPRLARMRFSTAEEIRALPHGRRARAAGIVTGRQRPDTASGVVFVTLEDETGYVNVVVWHDITERQRRELLGSRLMGVEGMLEREGEVVHLVARRLADHSALLGRLPTASRDFH
ncbi:MAG: error-prone DNA polymerase [Betaproteobacteria bacterium]|nr:error-prone DNA polymerase [Betaproteobacteria bacterium]